MKPDPAPAQRPPQRSALQAEVDHEVETAREQYRERLAFDPLTADSAWLEQKKRRTLSSLAGAGPTTPILDFGSASCEMSEVLTAQGHTTIAGDICLDMLAISRRRVQRLGHPRPRYLVFDGRRLPFRSGCFPRAVCWNVLHHFLEPEKPAGEILRVLAPGGQALFMEPLSSNPFRRFFEFRFRRQHSGIETSFRQAELIGRLESLGYRIENIRYQTDQVPDWILQRRSRPYRLATRLRIVVSRLAPRLFGSVSFLAVKPGA